jgi:hypothetical protein
MSFGNGIVLAKCQHYLTLNLCFMRKTAKDWRTHFGLKRKKTLGEKIMDRKVLIIATLAIATTVFGFRKAAMPFFAGLVSRR